MITRRTKIQLLVFVVITLLGVTYVGARYARLDKLFLDTDYRVVAHFSESGGVFTGAEVTYRGVAVGQVSDMVLTADGVDVVLAIENSHDDIPADTLAVVGNRSAVGEQFVELQPQVADGPVLEEGSQIPVENTRTPLPTTTLLTNLSNTVSSVDKDALATTVDELGKAFAGTGDDLQTILDTTSSFVETASDNLDITTKLIQDGNVVLDGQIASESSLRTFADQLSLFSDTLAGANGDLENVIDNGSFAANQLRGFLEDNKVDLSALLNNLVTTGEVVTKYLPGIQQVFVIYPYVVEGGFSVVSKDPVTGLYDAHFGMIITNKAVCYEGYKGTDRRPPSDGSNRPMNLDARCTEPAAVTNARGAQNIPRVGPDYGEQVVASYDPETGDLAWGDDQQPAGLDAPDSVAPRSFGKDAWTWLYLEPLTAGK
ncbi:MlaD family protein [Nocardioides sp.]|uniref:MlaD family protein n=1 Tax=Nocardioides sp. TaxID=35761 RepID=UPI0035120B80